MAIIFGEEEDVMVRFTRILVVCLAVLVVGFVASAAETDGLSGTVGVEAAFLPGFATDLWLELDGTFGELALESETVITLVPGFAATEELTVEISFGVFEVGGFLSLTLYPFSFDEWDLYAGIGLLDIAQDGFTASADARLTLGILPAFVATLSLDLDASYGIFTLWSDIDLAIPGFVFTVFLGAEARLLDLDVGEGWLTADLGAQSTVLPALDADLWFDVELTVGRFDIRSETDYVLTPFGLTEQRLELEIGFDGFSIYGWAGFTGAGDLTAGIGGTYDFP